MPFDHSEAERIVNMTDQQRLRSSHGPRAAALMGDEPKPKAPKSRATPHKGNVVAQQMKSQEFTQRFVPVFSKLREAVSAAERACQNPEHGVQSKQEADRLLERTLNDLIAVVTEIRDERKELIRPRSAEEQAHPSLVA
uniref:Uncharacterized protein n=1 Tax=Eiseniibacteriota bacterium TaxID=2212470 RepID=A0A832I1H2_UNCEI